MDAEKRAEILAWDDSATDDENWAKFDAWIDTLNDADIEFAKTWLAMGIQSIQTG